ncbi:Glu-tRNA(Gln) amidotransferase subunit GatE [Candidatus Woesearchaeota archaeon]|nr:Glu-tRNA(Gln) amidotransferase subunit GatE [Candidatus Woesearchaeota archaeon]
MTVKDAGLRCGIEIHQQLEGQKLFCGCPTLLREEEPDFTIKRQLRAVAGEAGEVDVAARQEQQKGKTFLYEGYADTTCLVETDEEPPHEMNKAALQTALQFCTIVQADVPSVVQVMRKTVVDGSNTSGFQRTALLGRQGAIKTSAGTIGIENISLEEDACRNIRETATERVFRLDRLGIPLIEIGTAPDITTPEQCLEAAKKIGLLLRSLPGVKRGLGTIRQDVNISIKGGNRIEIKGAQDLRLLPQLVELEMKRQETLLEIKKALEGTSLGRLEIIDTTAVLKNSLSSIIKNTLQKKGHILSLKLRGFAGFVGKEVQPGRRLGTEFSERAKVIAGVSGIFHSDELPKYGITAEEVEAVKKALQCTKKDAFILVADDEQWAQRALEAVYARAQEALQGVPKEVRKANPDGTTSYLRPMPGAARMYPETDVPLVVPDLKTITLPELLDEKIVRYQQKLGLSKDLAQHLALSDKMLLFEELVQQHPRIKPAFIAETLTSTLLDIKRQYAQDPEKLQEDDFRQLFQYLAEDKIHKDIVLDVLIDMITGKFDLKRYATLGTEEIHCVIKEVVAKNPGAPFSALMGQCMKQLAGKASGKFIAEELQKVLHGKHA